MNLKGKVAFITGGSRGIGKAIGIKLAEQGVHVAIAAKTVEPHPKLAGTIFTAAEEIERHGVKCLPIQMDVRHDQQVEDAMMKCAEAFGGIDFVINNASAIQLSSVEHTQMKRFDLMHQVNVRGTYLVSKVALPFLKKSDLGHILNLSPPPSLEPKWYENHLAYTLSKMGMSFCVLGMAREFESYNICVNALWPKTTIATAAVRNLLGGEAMVQASRKPSIVADAANAILSNKNRPTGRFFIDEEVLSETGVKDFESYAVDPDQDLMPDLFL